jgi:environmental stress-induced protein Ves
MPEVLHLTPADVRRRPWKNGRGATDELALWPLDASFERGTFDWRVSRARIEQPGPFSSFPGFERVLVVTAGAGLVLEHGAHAPRARLRTLEPYRFRGDWPTTAELPAGPVDDFGVLARLGAVEPAVEVLRLGRRRAREVLERGHALAHLLLGAVTARVTGEDEAFDLESGDSLWMRELRGGEEIDLQGGAEGSVVLLVRLGPPTS